VHSFQGSPSKVLAPTILPRDGLVTKISPPAAAAAAADSAADAAASSRGQVGE
jgi:hypothetical protein